MEKTLIHGLTRADVSSHLKDLNEPSYRSDQIWRWLYVSRVEDWASMTNLPAVLREKLAGSLTFSSLELLDTRRSLDSTTKLLARLPDGEAIELVVIPAERRATVCVSSQVGCRFKCAFCASGQSGFTRNLEAGEIVEEVLLAGRVHGEKPTHVVFMGIGEPFDNYDNVLKAIRIINDQDGLSIGARRITISTCGIVPGIKRLADEKLQVELSISLHAADDASRSRLMPVNNKYPLATLLEACREYTAQTGRIITFEYTMVRNVNDSRKQAETLARQLQSLQCRVNLIPLSAVDGYGEAASSSETCEMFINTLAKAGINATLRNSQGSELKAACGQLRAGRAAEGKV